MIVFFHAFSLVKLEKNERKNFPEKKLKFFSSKNLTEKGTKYFSAIYFPEIFLLKIITSWILIRSLLLFHFTKIIGERFLILNNRKESRKVLFLLERRLSQFSDSQFFLKNLTSYYENDLKKDKSKRVFLFCIFLNMFFCC